MKIFSLIIVLLFHVLLSYGQNDLEGIRLQVSAGKYDSAIALSNSIILKSKNKQEIGDAYCFSAFSYKKLNEPTKAISDYLNALHFYDKAKDKSSVYNNIGNIYTSFHLYSEAIQYFDKAITQKPDSIDLGRRLLNRAIAYKRVKKYDKALKDANNAKMIGVELDNKNLIYRAYNQLGLIQKDVGSYEKAIIFFEAANSLGIKKKTYVNLGTVYHLQKNIKLAIQYFQMAITSTRIYTKFTAYQNLGELYLEEKKLGQAYANISNAVKLFPELSLPDSEDARVFTLLSNYYKLKNQKDKSIETLELSVAFFVKQDEVKNEIANKFTQEALLKTENEFSLIAQNSNNLKEHKWKFTSVVLFSILIISLSFKGYWRLKLRLKKKETASAELKDSLIEIQEKFGL